MTLPHRPVVGGGDVHARAIERLELAVDDHERSSEQSQAAQGGPNERTAAVALAAANEQVAAREAWVKYIEHGYYPARATTHGPLAVLHPSPHSPLQAPASARTISRTRLPQCPPTDPA
jgi:hypothetical protein